MARSFASVDLVTLPRLTAISAARLLQQLLTAANEEKKLAPGVAAARDDLAAVREKLSTELAKRVSGAGEVTPVVRAADILEDNAFGALVDWLRSFARLPADRHPEAGQVQQVLGDAFKDGLEFLKLAPVNEWQEAEVRRAILEDKGHLELIKKLGGKPFLDELDFAHEGYGEAVGATVVKPVPETPAVRQMLDEAREELRAYVLAVSSQVKKKDPTSQATAARLLAPLIHWKDTPAKPDDTAAPAGPAPAAAPAPSAAPVPAGP